jgi:UDPglucose 6-dehydrogenase
MKITVIGTGYVGLVTGACLSEMGNDVVCLDLDPEKIHVLNDGAIPIYEPGLKEMVRRGVEARRLRFTTSTEQAVAHGTILFIAVGTPPCEDGSADIKSVIGAARDIGLHMTDYKLVVDKATVPVGTADRVKAAIQNELKAREISVPFGVVSNPEFLREGSAVQDFMRPDRIIVGAEDGQAILLMRALYAPYIRNHDRLLVMDIRSAELTKYAANAMLATRISFMNEFADLAEDVGADIESVRLGIGSDSRIGYSALYAGCGYGGSCLPKDVKSLIKTAKDYGRHLLVLESVESANDAQKHVLAAKIKARFGNDLSGKHFALWGLAFKPNTDDMRDAPSSDLIVELLAAGATLSAYDPAAIEEAKRRFEGETRLSYAANSLDACEGADALIIVTEWKEFRSPDFAGIRARLRSPVIFDGRNVFEPALPRSLGIEYCGIGRR